MPGVHDIMRTAQQNVRYRGKPETTTTRDHEALKDNHEALKDHEIQKDIVRATEANPDQSDKGDNVVLKPVRNAVHQGGFMMAKDTEANSSTSPSTSSSTCCAAQVVAQQDTLWWTKVLVAIVVASVVAMCTLVYNIVTGIVNATANQTLLYGNLRAKNDIDTVLYE
jgi:hypothetical protein